MGEARMCNMANYSLLLLTCLLLTSGVRKGSSDKPALTSKIQEVGGLEPFSAGLAVGGGMVLSALWSGREVGMQIAKDTP